MTIADASKARVIDGLQVSLQKGTRLRLILLLRKDQTASVEVHQRNRELQGRIDQLLEAAMEDWAGDAKSVLAELKAANRALQGSIHDVRKKVRTAERVTRALGILDGVIEQARKLVAP